MKKKSEKLKLISHFDIAVGELRSIGASLLKKPDDEPTEVREKFGPGRIEGNVVEGEDEVFDE